MDAMDKEVYRSRIDWWLWCMLVFALVVVCVVAIGSYWWLAVMYGVALGALWVVMLLGCRYEIAGDRLVVYQFYMPHAYPIGRIKEVEKTTGFPAAAGTSRHKVSIRFTDRSVMKGSRPLEVSPMDRDGFMAALKRVNPSIVLK